MKFLNKISFIFIIFISFFSYGFSQKAIEYRNRGQKALQLGQIDDAIKFFKKASKLDPQYALVHNDLGVVYELKRLDKQAEAEYKKALEINPKLVSAHMNLALLYEKIGKRKQAIKHFIERIRLGDPEDPWTKRAWEKLWKNSPESANKLKKEMASRYCENGSFYFKKGNYEKAKFWFQEAVKLMPENKLYEELYKKADFEIRLRKIKQLVKEGMNAFQASNFSQAKEDFGKILELIPSEK